MEILEQNSFPIHLVVENIGPNMPAGLPYRSANLLSFNPYDKPGGKYDKFVVRDGRVSTNEEKLRGRAGYEGMYIATIPMNILD